MITKTAKIARDAKGQLRNYRDEYQSYHAKPGQVKNRSTRNKARRVLGLKPGDKREVDHKVPLSRGGSNTKRNLQAVSRLKNRSKFTS
jgi:5-methylcytosine-specific restriction endonuclease McrA